MQVELDFERARAVGTLAEQACADAAKRKTSFDIEGARDHALGLLVCYGQMRGEAIVDALKAVGFVAHDDRAYGAVFSALSRRKLIRCVGFCVRAKGHGTAGGRIWEAV